MAYIAAVHVEKPVKTNSQATRAIFLGASAVSLLLWIPLAVKAGSPSAWAWDTSLQATVHGWHLPWLTALLTVINWSGITPVVTVTILALVIVLFIRKSYRYAGLFTIIGLFELGNQAVQALIGRTRPDPLVQATNDSFPSGHAFHFVLFGGFLLYLLLPRLTSSARWLAWAAYVVIVLIIGFSRVFLGYHWPTDVLGGYLLAVPAFTAVMLLHQRWLGRASRKETGKQS